MEHKILVSCSFLTMGFFGFFKDSPESNIRKLGARVANKRAQPPERWDAIEALAKIGTPEALEAILPRFTFYVEPSILDQEEKDLAFQTLVHGKEKTVVGVKRFLRQAESVSWSLKILDQIISAEEVVTTLLELLQGMDVEYERDPQRKIQILAALEERQDSRVPNAVLRFLDDVNETCRFHSVGALLNSSVSEESLRVRLAEHLGKEESQRVRIRLLDGFSAHAWKALDSKGQKPSRLPPGYVVDAQGLVRSPIR